MRSLLIVALLVVLAPASASAAVPPDRTATLTAASPAFAWDGQEATAAAPQQSAQGYDPALCSKDPDYYCDVTLVKLDAAPDTTAELEFAINEFSFACSDFDISIFHSDANGTPGEFIANGGNLSAACLEETVTVADAAPGYYLATVSYYFSPGATYKGSVKATGIVPPPAAPAPPAATDARPAPPPAFTPKPVAKKKPSCRAKARRIKSASKRKAALRKCARRRPAARGR